MSVVSEKWQIARVVFDSVLSLESNIQELKNLPESILDQFEKECLDELLGKIKEIAFKGLHRAKDY